METAKTKYLGHLRTEATHLLSGNTIITDAPPDNNGKGEAFSPTDLLATSLASCMITIMGILANRINVDINGTSATTTKIMASNPRRVSEIHVSIYFPQNNTYTDKEKRMLEEAAHACPVAKSLHPDILQKIEFIYQ